MTLHPPFCITSRLLAGVRIGQTEISIEIGKETNDGRIRYRYHLDGPGIEHTGDDLKSGVGGGSLVQGMASLLSFLGAAAESYRYCRMDWDKIGEDDNASLFPREVTEWAYQNDDEISMLQLEIEESEVELIEA